MSKSIAREIEELRQLPTPKLVEKYTEIWGKAAAEAPVRFSGKKLPPSTVSDAVFRCIEKRRHEATVPRSLWWIFLLKLLMPGRFRKGVTRYDPVPRDVIDRARQAAQN